MMMMTLSMTSSTASHEPLIYCPISAPNGTRLCGVDDLQQISETFATGKLTSCALATMASRSALFNYKSNLTHRQCTLFQSVPWFFTPVDNCVGYEVVTYTGFFVIIIIKIIIITQCHNLHIATLL